MLETSMKVPNSLCISKKEKRNTFLQWETTRGFCSAFSTFQNPDFPRNLDLQKSGPQRVIRSPCCIKICSNPARKFWKDGLDITPDNEALSSKQGNLSDLELSPRTLPRQGFSHQNIPISGKRRPLHTKIGHMRTMKPLCTRCVVLRRISMPPAVVFCLGC